MAEQINYTNYASESLVARLYYFREAAREYLAEKNGLTENKETIFDATPLSRMMGRLPYLLDDVANDKADEILNRLCAPITDILFKADKKDFATKSWFLENISQAAQAEMVSVIKEGKLLQAKKEKIEQKIAETGGDKVEAKALLEESSEAALMRAEITGIIQKSRKFSDDEKRAMLDALSKAPEIIYSKKKGQMTYSFGDFAVTGFIAEGNTDMRNHLGQRIYSAGEQFDKEFVKNLKSRGKIKTAIGEKNKSLSDTAKKDDKKIKVLKQQLQDVEQKIETNQVQQEKAFANMVKSLSPQFLLFDMSNPKGAVATIAEKSGQAEDWETAKENVIGATFTNKTVWGAYLECENSTRSFFSDEVEKVLNRHNARQNLIDTGRKFYGEFEKMASGADKQFNVSRVDDEMLTKLFNRGVAQIHADLPLNVKREVLRQEIFRQALTRDGNISFNKQKFQMMNRVLMLEGMKIELKEVPIKQKLNTDSARSFSGVILDDMRKGYTLQQRHKTEAFLYYMGKFRAQHKDKNLKSTERNPGANFLFSACSEIFYGQYSDSPRMKVLWDKFVSDPHNLRQADAMYQMFHRIKVPGIDAEKLVEKLANGNGLNDAKSVASQSKHHQLYRRFAGFFGQDITELNALFNAPERIIDTIAIHPALKDMHRDVEHRFDMGEEYLYQKANGQVLFGAYSSGQVGDTLLMPVVCVKNKEGAFEPLMKEGTLLMTSAGVVKMPHFEGDGQGLRKLYHSTGARINA